MGFELQRNGGGFKMKKKLGKQIEALRKECGVSTYELEQKRNTPFFTCNY